MIHLFAVLALALLCAVWVLVQLESGRGPRSCRGDAACGLDERGDCGECSDDATKRGPRLVSKDEVARRRPER
ncbi:MAG: hypothetical protein ACOC9T_01955 [Myxococcota bacterium]